VAQIAREEAATGRGSKQRGGHGDDPGIVTRNSQQTSTTGERMGEVHDWGSGSHRTENKGCMGAQEKNLD